MRLSFCFNPHMLRNSSLLTLFWKNVIHRCLDAPAGRLGGKGGTRFMENILLDCFCHHTVVGLVFFWQQVFLVVDCCFLFLFTFVFVFSSFSSSVNAAIPALNVNPKLLNQLVFNFFWLYFFFEVICFFLFVLEKNAPIF